MRPVAAVCPLVFRGGAGSGILVAMRALRPLLVVTDVGFLVYWLLTGLRLIPAAWAFKDYDDPILVAWNWSFLPLDLCISATGFTSIVLHRRGSPAWRGAAIVSLTLTLCSGLQAVAFWAIRRDFDVSWWAPNLFLFGYPLFFLPRLVRGR